MANEKWLIDANHFAMGVALYMAENAYLNDTALDVLKKVSDWLDEEPTVDAVEVVHGRWELTAHKESCNCRWNVKAECSECHHRKGEVYAGFFLGFSDDVVRDTILDNAKSVKLDNYCPNCGAKMDGDGNG